jgi:hypothetical protein
MDCCVVDSLYIDVRMGHDFNVTLLSFTLIQVTR